MESEYGRLGDPEVATLAAFADGSLPHSEHELVAARVRRSPSLLELVEQQRSAIVAVALLDAPAPARLQAAVAGLVPSEAVPASPSRPVRRRPRSRLLLAGGFATALAAVALAAVVMAPGSGGPTVGDTVELSDRGASAPAPRVDPDDHALLAT